MAKICEYHRDGELIENYCTSPNGCIYLGDYQKKLNGTRIISCSVNGVISSDESLKDLVTKSLEERTSFK